MRRGFKLGAQEDPSPDQPPTRYFIAGRRQSATGFLEQDQYERLLEELSKNLKALFVCGYHTGARKNELRRLRWDQVDFESRLIRLSAVQTKAKKPRTLPIYGDMPRWLEHQRENLPPGST